jgi:hypothetical protein
MSLEVCLVEDLGQGTWPAPVYLSYDSSDTSRSTLSSVLHNYCTLHNLCFGCCTICKEACGNAAGERPWLMAPRDAEEGAGAVGGVGTQGPGGAGDGVQSASLTDMEEGRESGGPAREQGMDQVADAPGAGGLAEGGSGWDEAAFEFPAPLTGIAAQEAVLSNKDLVLRVFHFLAFPQVAHSAFVNTAWRAVAESKEFWSSVNMEGRPVTLDQVGLLRTALRMVML